MLKSRQTITLDKEGVNLFDNRLTFSPVARLDHLYTRPVWTQPPLQDLNAAPALSGAAPRPPLMSMLCLVFHLPLSLLFKVDGAGPSVVAADIGFPPAWQGIRST